MPSKKWHTALVRTDSTAFGPHYWGGWIVCPRKAWLAELEKQHRDPGKLSGIAHFDIGSILHALLALHYSLDPNAAMALNTGRIRYVTAAGPLEVEDYAQAIAEAERLYRAYRVYWGKADLGKVVAVEKELGTHLPCYNGQETIPVTMTGGLDLVVRLTARDLKRQNLDGSPGLYIVDHKTRGQKDPIEYEMALHDLQFSTYPKLWDSVEKKLKDKVQGFLVNLLYKTKTPTFERFIVPKMALRAEWLRSEGLYAISMRERSYALSLVEAGGLPEARITACFKKHAAGWDICQFHKNGKCDRLQQPVPRKVPINASATN